MYLNMFHWDKEPVGWVMISTVEVVHASRSVFLPLCLTRKHLALTTGVHLVLVMCFLLHAVGCSIAWIILIFRDLFAISFPLLDFTSALTLPLEMSQEDSNIHALFRVKDCDLKRKATKSIHTVLMKQVHTQYCNSHCLWGSKNTPEHCFTLAVPHWWYNWYGTFKNHFLFVRSLLP